MAATSEESAPVKAGKQRIAYFYEPEICNYYFGAGEACSSRVQGRRSTAHAPLLAVLQGTP